MKKILFLIGLILLLGGCEMNGAKLSVPKDTTREELMMPENSEKVNDEFSGSKWTGQVGQEKYQIRFDPENNICRIYRGHINWGYQKWYYDMPCLRKYENDKIIFDFKPYIDYAESYSMEKCWIESYAMFKEYYEDSKKIFQTATDPEIKDKAKEAMNGWANSMKDCETFESFKKVENVDENWFQPRKNSHTQSAAGLKAVNPVTAILSADKKTLTLKKMFIGLKKR